MLTAAVLVVVGASAVATRAITTITSDSTVAQGKTFDYIIAGGGLSGITVANKLSAAGNTVLIIEAGDNLPDVPGIYNAERRGELGTTCNWKYPAYADDGTALSWQIDSGKCVGGSTSINGMVWYRPAPKEMDAIGDLGNAGWNWASLEPYMDEIEGNIPPNNIQVAQGAGYDPAVHGFDGAVSVSFPTPMRIPYAQALYKAAIPQVFPGLNVTNDLSARTGAVSASTSWTIKYDPTANINRRSSAAYSLLYPDSQQRDTLTVLTGHRVATVTFNADKKATGVTFGSPSVRSRYTATARKEVILAAGSLQSGPILERSGIGAKSVLDAANITQLVDLPGVGLNLVDQPGTGTSALVQSDMMSNTSLIDGRNIFAPVITLPNIEQLFGTTEAATIKSQMTSTLAARAQALVDAGAAFSYESAKLILKTIAKQITTDKIPIVEFVGESYPAVMTAVFWPLIPQSRGHVHIASSNPFADPIITPRLYSDEFDVKFGVKVARKSRELFTSAPFQAVVADAYADPATVGANATDADYEAFIIQTSYAASHWMGATSMLPRALGGVVNANLQVYGTKGLRIVDVGVLPLEISSHTMSTAYAVALKAAALILA